MLANDPKCTYWLCLDRYQCVRFSSVYHNQNTRAKTKQAIWRERPTREDIWNDSHLSCLWWRGWGGQKLWLSEWYYNQKVINVFNKLFRSLQLKAIRWASIGFSTTYLRISPKIFLGRQVYKTRSDQNWIPSGNICSGNLPRKSTSFVFVVACFIDIIFIIMYLSTELFCFQCPTMEIIVN